MPPQPFLHLTRGRGRTKRCVRPTYYPVQLTYISFAVKTLILEALTMIAPRTLAMCIAQVQRDANLKFDFKLVDGEHIRISIECRLTYVYAAIVRSERYVSTRIPFNFV
jgi:hypothetical protein